MQVGDLKIGDKFYHKNCTYEVLEFSYCFVVSKKIPNDGVKHYLLRDIEVKSRNFCENWSYSDNPNHVINDKYGRR